MFYECVYCIYIIYIGVSSMFYKYDLGTYDYKMMLFKIVNLLRFSTFYIFKIIMIVKTINLTGH